MANFFLVTFQTPWKTLLTDLSTEDLFLLFRRTKCAYFHFKSINIIFWIKKKLERAEAPTQFRGRNR